MQIRRFAFLLTVFVLFAFSAVVMAQDTTTTSPTTTEKPAKEKKDKKKKDKKDTADDKDSGYDTTVFSERVANDVLGQIRDGLEGHSQRLMLGAFDGDKMDGYLTFEDQIQAYFEKYEGFRVHFRILQTSIEGPKGVINAEFQVEGMPRSGGAPSRRANQIRFELERGKKGWRVVDFSPRGFFS